MLGVTVVTRTRSTIVDVYNNMPLLEFSPSIQSKTFLQAKQTSFVQPKLSQIQPPKKVETENMFEISSDDSGSDGDEESDKQLNDIFERFLGNKSKSVTDDQELDDDDTGHHDYYRLMSNFRFDLDDSDNDNDSYSI